MATTNIYKIYGAYSWKDSDHKLKNYESINVFHSLINQVKNRLQNNLNDKSIKIRYNRLRATAGAIILP